MMPHVRDGLFATVNATALTGTTIPKFIRAENSKIIYNDYHVVTKDHISVYTIFNWSPSYHSGIAI